MANRLNKNPKVIDTVDTSLPGPITIKRMVWCGTAVAGKDIAAADVLTINANANSGTGQVLWDQKATAAELGPHVIYQGDGWNLPDGLFVDVMDGGELFIWV